MGFFRPFWRDVAVGLRGGFIVALVGVALSCAQAAPGDVALPISEIPSGAQTTAAASDSSATAAPATLRHGHSASDIFARMGRFLANQQTFFVEINSTTTITGSGKTRENGGLSRVWYRRPNHVVWTTQSDIGASALAVNGNSSTLYLPALSKYMVSPVVGAPDSQVAAMSAPYGMLVMSLFTSHTTRSLEAVLTGEPQLLADEKMLGVPCNHLKLPTRNGEVDLWIADGMIPLPVKITFGMSIPASPGEDNAIKSETEVSFRWRVNVDLPDSTFQLKLPETAVRADKLGSPVVVAKLRPHSDGPAKESKRKRREKSDDDGDSSRKDKRDANDLGLAFEPPPDVNAPLRLRSALERSSAGNLPSLSGKDREDAIVRAAIRGSKPDAVPSGTSYQPQQDASAPPPPSSAAKSPGVHLTLLDGRQINLSDYRGEKAVVLDFWATWCGPCRQSMPVVGQMAQAWRGRGVEFFAVNMNEDVGEIRQFMQQNGVQIPVAVDPGGQLAKAFGVSGIPHLVVIGKDGTIKGTHTGADSSLRGSLMRDLAVAVR